MTAQSLNCPNCAAPLQLNAGQSRTFCIYCGSAIYVAADTGAPEVKTELPDDAQAELRQLFLEGRRAEAIQLYKQRTGASDTEAQETLKNLSQSLTRKALFEQPISNLGILQFVVIDLICLGILAWSAVNNIWWLAAIAAALFTFETFTFRKAIYVRFLEELGKPAPAAIRKVVRLGELKLRSEPEPIQVVRLWLEVRPENEPIFQAEKTVAMRRQSFEQLQPGIVIAVKYNSSGQVFPAAPMKILSGS